MYFAWKHGLFRQFTKDGQRLNLIVGDSHEDKTLGKLSIALGAEELDFLFIDGDHRLEGVAKDFNKYSPYVRKGGLVAFHDIVHQDSSANGCAEYWNTIRDSYKHAEIVKDSNGRSGGIGLLWI